MGLLPNQWLPSNSKKTLNRISGPHELTTEERKKKECKGRKVAFSPISKRYLGYATEITLISVYLGFIFIGTFPLND